jgi:hypothetical protein
MAKSQQVLLSYVMPDGKTGMVYFDATLNETHGAQAQVTDHKVESGPNIADYIRPMPRRLSLSSIITNTPISTPQSQSRGVVGQVGTFQGQTGRTWKAVKFSGEFDRVRDVFGVLVDAALAGATFGVVTTLANYENLAITNFSVPRDASSGNALNSTIDFQEIVTVDTQTVEALPPTIQKTHRGPKPPKALDDNDQKAQRSRSFLRSVLGGGG